MKKNSAFLFCMKSILSFSAMVLASGTPADTAKPVRVFLLAGQSNMAGRAPIAELPAPLQLPQDDVLFFSGTSLTTLRPGRDQFGPEVTFGRALADAYPDETFALIKYAKGGTSLVQHWNPETGEEYENFRSTVTKGLAALTEAGHTYEIVGMLWTQGERDALTWRKTAQYTDDLNAFIADIRNRYGNNLPFFLSRLSSGQTSIKAVQLANIRTAQENVAAASPTVWMVDTDDMGVLDDNLHFNAPGQIALGEAFAQVFLKSISRP